MNRRNAGRLFSKEKGRSRFSAAVASILRLVAILRTGYFDTWYIKASEWGRARSHAKRRRSPVAFNETLD